MERWASNTLRVLGIIVTSLVMVVGSLLLLLLSMCAWGGGFEGGGAHKDQAVGYLVGAVVLLVLSIFVIAKLGKGIAHTSALQGASQSTDETLPTIEPLEHISPSTQTAIRQLIYTIVAAIVVNALRTAASIFWPSTRFRYGFGISGTAVLFLLYQLPYAIVLVALGRRPNRRAFAYALATPLASITLILFGLPLALPYYLHAPVQLGFLLLSVALEAFILWMAWKASQRIGYKQQGGYVLIAGAVMLVYFGLLQYVLAQLLLSVLWR